MDLGLSEHQQLLQRTAREFLEAECPITLVRDVEETQEGYSPELWRKMAGLGWLGLAIPMEYDGEGGTLLDHAVLFEEIGRAMVPGPLIPSCVFSVQAILASGSDEQKAKLLPAMARGEIIVTATLSEPGIGYSDETAVKAVPDGRGYLLDGATMFVPYAQVADYILCVAGAQVQTFAAKLLAAILVDSRSPGVATVLMESIAGYKQHQVTFQQARVTEDDVLGAPGGAYASLARAEDWATIVQCAEIVGRSEKVLDMVVEYSKNRVAFGRPIGSFQAIQHQCADLQVAVDGARMITRQAAWKLTEGLPCAEDISIAKAHAGTLSRQATATGHGIFAGIAFTVEHDMQLYTMRSKIAEVNLGDTDFHLDKLAERMGF